MTHAHTHPHADALTTETLLMRYAAGVLPPYESMLMAAYLTVSEDARQRMASFEAEGGRMIESVDPVSVTQTCLNNILAMTQPQQHPAGPAPAPCSDARKDGGDCSIPKLLRKLVDAHCPQQKLSWDHVSPGIAKIDITLCRSEPRTRRLRLLRLDPHQTTPVHHHLGTEITLVLEGGYTDETGSYNRGDMVIVTDPALRHSPRAMDSGCTCLSLTEAPLRFDNMFVQLFNIFRRI